MSLNLTPSTIIDRTYQLVEKIGEGGSSTVFRALDLFHHREVALKFLKEGVTSSFIEDVVRFKQEIALISRLSDPGIIHLHGAGEYEGVPYIITELLQGKNLSDFLLEQNVLPLSVTLDIMRQLVQSLNTMHVNGVIHRDLKPDNIMIHKVKDQYVTKILDFGLSLLLDFEQIKSEVEIAGTFAYMSPEGTGILKKKIDERSDLYSLGITFYQLLTGEVPFKSKEASKLIHEQIAAIPVAPCKIKRDIPSVLERIVLKLLQKDPELRYQTAKGLLYDIQRFQQGQADFVIGEKDQKVRLSYQTGTVGREEEIEKLKFLFAESQEGRGKVCVLEGETGIGKNKLVDEVKKWAFENHFLFLEGRCLDQANKSPHYPFREAMNQYLKKMNRMDPREKEEHIQKIKSVVGEQGAVVKRLHTGLADLLGPTVRPTTTLERDAENHRFLTVAANLFLNLSSTPLVLFIDDLQWADEGTLDLFKEIASKAQGCKFFLIGATSPSKAVGQTLENLKEQNVPFAALSLKPLSSQSLNRLMAQILGEKEEKCLQLSDYIFEKSQGNPFFSVTALREFVEAKALIWGENGWEADWDKIKKIRLPGNMVHWIIEKIDELSKNELELLSLCALLGQEVDLNLLLFTVPYSTEDVFRMLDHAAHLQIVSPLSRGKMIFSHEKVRNCFLEKLAPETRKNNHFKIAQTIEIFYQNLESIFFIIKNLPSEKRNYHLKMISASSENKKKLEPYFFRLAHHYEHSGDKERALEYGLLAAHKARDEFANDQAIYYYTLVIHLLEEKGRGSQPDCLAAKEELAEICLNTGKYEKAKHLLQDILNRKQNSFEKLNIYHKVIAAHLKKGDLALAENYSVESLTLLGDQIPTNRISLWLATLKEVLLHGLHRLIPFVKTLKKVEAEDQEKVLFYLNLHQVYSLTDSQQLFWCSFKLLNLAESKIGKSPELSSSRAAFAVLAASRGRFKTAERYFKGAVRLEEEGPKFNTNVYPAWSYCKMWEGKTKEGLDLLADPLMHFRETGDLWAESKTLEALGYGHLISGNHEKAVFFYSQSLRISQKIADSLGLCSSHSYLSYCFAMQGDFEKAEDHAKKALALSQEKECPFYQALAHLHFGILEIERAKHEDALSHLEKAKQTVMDGPIVTPFFASLYPSLAEAQLEALKTMDNFSVQQKNRKKNQLRLTVKQMLASQRSAIVEQSYFYRVLAKYEAFLKNHSSAEKNFKNSIATAGAQERRFELAKSYFECARFLEERVSLNDFLKKSTGLFDDIGASVYLKKISSLSGAGPKASRHTHFSTDRHMSVVLNTSRYLSSILDLDELLEKIMDGAIQLVGAERGLLFLYSEEGTLELRVLRNIDKDDMEKGRAQISRGIIKKVEKEKKPLLVDDAMHDLDLKTNVSVIREEIKSVVCVPILTRRDMLGLLYVDNRLVSGAFNHNDLHSLGLIANQAGVSIENAKLYQRAITDGMTGLYNRVFFDEYIYKNLQLAQRYNKKLSLIIFDVDRFKHINDHYGHPAGDMIIQGVSQALKSRLRQSDIASRFGGDEFAAILPETSLEQAKMVGENLRKYVLEQSFDYQGQNIKITLSIGVCEFVDGQSRLEFVQEADKALYAAKQAGRNQVKTNLDVVPLPRSNPAAA